MNRGLVSIKDINCNLANPRLPGQSGKEKQTLIAERKAILGRMFSLTSDSLVFVAFVDDVYDHLVVPAASMMFCLI